MAKSAILKNLRTYKKVTNNKILNNKFQNFYCIKQRLLKAMNLKLKYFKLI